MTDVSLIHQLNVLTGKVEEESLAGKLQEWKKKLLAEHIEECFLLIESHDRRGSLQRRG